MPVVFRDRGRLQWLRHPPRQSRRHTLRRVASAACIDYNCRIELPMVRSPSAGSGAALHATMCGTDVATYIRERPGVSTFVLEDGVVYHTYSAYARGIDALWAMHQWLDPAPAVTQ